MPLYHLPGADVQHIAVNRSHGHRYIMSLLNDGLDTTSPRATAKLLWALTPEGVLVQTSLQLSSATQIPSPETPTTGEQVTLTGDITILYSPVVSVPQELWGQGFRPQTPKKVTVPEKDRAAILTHRLEQRGLNVTALTLSDPKTIKIGRGEKAFTQTYFTTTVTGTVTNEDTFTSLLINGFGKARNYGLGWLRLI